MNYDKPIHILLVEDQDGEARLLAEMLQENGSDWLNLTRAADLDSALQCLANAPCDLILLDLTLPDSHGFATFATVNAAAPDKAIVVLTGLDDRDLALRAVQDGAEDFLIKGKCPADLLCRSVCYALERKRIHEELRRHRDNLDELVQARTQELLQVNAQLQAESERRQQLEGERLKSMKLESLSVLAGGIAHDFNNILTAIHGNIALVQFDIDSSSQAGSCLSQAEKACRRAKSLTQQLLTFSKGGAPVRTTAPLAESICEAAEFVLRGSNVKCQFNLSDELWPASVDVGQICQVIQNLVINANQAMPAGGTIWVSASNLTVTDAMLLPVVPGYYICIEVRDSGSGIAAEHLNSIFDPYFTTKTKGSGLGLAVSHSIVRNHGGHIAVGAPAKGGAVLSVYLPAEPTATVSVADQQPCLQSDGSARILVMDDEEAIRALIQTVLERRGFYVCCAADGHDTVAQFRQAEAEGQPFDVVILDLTVPGGMGGKETLMQLRQSNRDIRALVSSGYCNNPILSDYRSHGFNGAVVKPFAIAELVQAVADVLAATNSPVTSDV